MKKRLLALCAVGMIGTAAFAQCDPLSHDWQGAAFGVSPDPNQGETFDQATLGVAYGEVIYVKAPSDAGDIDETFAGLGVVIDSLRLDGITVFNGVEDININDIGLTVTCNNNGDSPDPCMFLGGNPYCGDISGVPTVAGEFPAKIFVTAYVQFFGTQAIPYEFENYTLTVLDPNTVSEEAALAVTLNPNTPNPADDVTSISFELTRNENVHLVVSNLLGERVFEKNVSGKRGENSVRLSTAEFENGVYLYSIQAGDKKFTRRLVVQH